jgi:hypothetical protein
MAAIEYAFKQVVTQQTNTNGSYTAITGAALAADWSGATLSSGTGFTAGKKYLLVIQAYVTNGTAGNSANVRIMHGSTAFADSEMIWNPSAAGDRYTTYQWFTVWTAVGSEAITLQGQSSGGTTQKIDFVSMFAMNLSDSLTESTDWIYDGTSSAATTDLGLTTTPQNGASITFTPGTPSQDWLVLSNAQISFENNTNSAICSLSRSGEATSSTPASVVRAAASGRVEHQFFSRVFTLGAASNTFTELSSNSALSAHTRLESRIFALNLHKFAHHFSAYTDGDTGTLADFDVAAYGTELQTATVTPTTSTSMVIGASWVADIGSYNRRFKFRSQTYVDGGAQSDQPAGQTTASYITATEQQASSSELPFSFLTVMSQTGGNTYRTDVDGSADDVVGAPTVQHRSLWGFSAELTSTLGAEAGTDSGAVQATEAVQPITVGVGAVEAG